MRDTFYVWAMLARMSSQTLSAAIQSTHTVPLSQLGPERDPLYRSENVALFTTKFSLEIFV